MHKQIYQVIRKTYSQGHAAYMIDHFFEDDETKIPNILSKNNDEKYPEAYSRVFKFPEMEEITSAEVILKRG